MKEIKLQHNIIHYEEVVSKAVGLLQEHRLPFLASLGIGLLTHMFMFTNKLINLDDIFNLFDKGASITSGRWGLELLRGIFPDYSMPWFYGIISLILISISVCMTIRLFEIRNRYVQVLFAGIMVSFPALTGVFSYMFTSAPYMLSMLLAVSAVVLCEKGGKANTAMAAVCAFFSLSIYQAFIELIASYFVLMLVKKVISGRGEPAEVIRTGICRVLFLLAVMVAYYASVKLMLVLTHSDFNDYASNNFTTESVNLVRRVYVAFVNFIYFFTRYNWGLINTPLSLAMHLTALGVVGVVLLGIMKKLGMVRTLLLGFLGGMLILAMNSMYLIVNEDAIHTLTLFSFASLYVLFAIVFEALMQEKKLGRDLLLIAMTVIMLNNIFIANNAYLQLHMAYEQAYGIFNSIVTQIQQTEGFDEDKTIAIIGKADIEERSYPWFKDEKIAGIGSALVNVYSRERFFQYYLGFDVNYATDDEKEELSQRPEFEQMAVYPYYGSVQVIDQYIVVKLGEE